MNTSQLKRFAQEARIKLLQQVEAKLSFVLTSDSPELREKANEIKQLNDELSKTTKAQLIEKVAYTWFNRLMALRFMDANDYQPLGIRIITPKDGYTLPELLDAAKQGNIPDELPVKTQHIYDLLDEKVKSANPQNEAYKELLIGACNHLNKVFPFLFERIIDYTELLIPDDLISEFSIVQDVREGMSTEDCQEVEIIGWLYQFYISELNDELISSKKKYKKEDLAPASQLFTPKWIVQYMVDNTLGQLWTEINPNTNITSSLEFYIKPAYKKQLSPRKPKSIEEIKFFEPCAGSGHILSYAFDVFYKIYEEQGYNPTEIPELIITKNLFGVDIDERAAQLASFVLLMKGQKKHRRFLRSVERNNIQPNISFYRDYEFDAKFKNASTLGSLIKVEPHEIEKIDIDKTSLFGERQKEVKKLYKLLGQRYDVVVTNPPYIGSSRMEGDLKQYVEVNYPETKSDLFATFVLRCLELCNEDGLTGYMTPFVWMFISSYEKLRTTIIDHHFINNLIQLEYSGFDGATVPICTFTLRNQNIDDAKGSYIRLSDFKGSQNQAPKTLEAIQDPDCGWFYTSNQNDFEKIPGNPIAYWVSKGIIEAFSKEPIGDNHEVREGVGTRNDERFIRYSWEIEIEKLGVNKKWLQTDKAGGGYKWYNQYINVLNWANDGHEIRNYRNKDGSLKSRPQNIQFFFKKAVSWGKVSSSNRAFRFRDNDFGFNDAAPSIFGENIEYILAILNSKVSEKIIEIKGGTLNLTVGTIKEIPLLYCDEENITHISNLCIALSKEYWATKDLDINFTLHFFHKMFSQVLKESYDLYQQYWKTKFFQLHKNEEELNRHFIEIYGLQEELTPDVPLEDITILKDELEQRELKKLSDSYKSGWVLNDNKWELNSNNLNENISLPFNAKEIFAQFMSYAVGCMFGRYSLDKEGLILANQGETLEDYIKIVNGGMMDNESKDGEITKNQDYDKGLQGTEDLAAEHGVGNECLSTNETNAEGGNLQSNRSNQESSSKHSKQHSGRTSQGDKGVSSLPEDSSRVSFGIGDAIDDHSKSENVEKRTNRTFAINDNQSKKTSLHTISETSINQSPTPKITIHQPPKSPSTNPQNHHPPIHHPTFYPDDDNIIPILDEEWFEDDIVGRFYEFLKVSFGEDNFSKNLAFVEEQLGKDIRRYFMRDFYADHIKRYKRRPIYWLFSSPKGSFNVLIYMHRYTRDTVSNILNKYLREFSGKLKTRKETLQHIIVHGDASDKTKAIKENDSIDKILLDLHEYERDILYPIAADPTPIDLDDGVLVNYNKFGNALKAVPGLNDKKTKDKVRKFDWIDSSTII